MAEAVFSTLLEKLALPLGEEEVRLVVGVDEEVEKLDSNFRAIKSLLEDAECKQFKDKRVRDWLDKIKDVSYDIEDVLDEWNTAIQTRKIMEAEIDSNLLKKVCSLIMSCFCLCSFRPAFMRHDIASKIKRLTKTLDVIASERVRYQLRSIEGTGEVERPITTSSVDESEIQGRDDVKENIKSLLLSESSNAPTSLTIISIVGMGGIGKTTLARLVFKDDEVTAHFDKKIWVCVSDPFDEIRIGKAILESLTKAAPNVNEFEQVLNNIQVSIKDKKFLLVLDDVWTEDPNKWEQLKNTLKHGSKESRVLVTTRKMNVAEVLESTHKIQLEILSDQVSWSLFRQFAFSGRTDEECHKFEEVGRRIAEKCDGLPLAVKTLGGLLRSKNTVVEWQGVLDSEMWELDEVEKGIFAPLLLSYIDLPSELKRCFSYCAIFPKDYEIGKDQLIKLWMAQDYLRAKGNKDMELVGEEYFEKLAIRSFFQDFVRDQADGSIITCKMHDMVHDMAQYLTKNECFSVEVDSAEGLNACYKNVRHSMVVLKREASFPISTFDENRLRSLLFHSDDWPNKHMYIDTPKLFDHMSCLRALLFCVQSIQAIPIDVNKLIHLRYLTISGNMNIKELPEAVCELYNLQTLNINGCWNLKKLPERIGKLVNLRHLINYKCFSLEYMSKGIERLTCLRTLDNAVVSGDKKACKFECLRNLNHLGGDLRMTCRGVDVGEINKAEFKNKTKLLSLWIFMSSEEEDVSNTNEEALEDFQPPPNLERLSLTGYRGASRLSLSWMMSLTKLRNLSLESWSHIGFDRLSLWKLPCLESLWISSMESVKSVGDEFVGMESDNISSFSSSSLVIAFPKLQSLLFDTLPNWEEWDCGASGRGEEQIKIMPCLRSLKIYWCPKLKTLPDYLLQSTTLEKLDIRSCPNLERRYKEKAENCGFPKIRFYENPGFVDDLESSSPSVVSFDDDVEDE